MVMDRVSVVLAPARLAAAVTGTILIDGRMNVPS
jgi:hypothetical protein